MSRIMNNRMTIVAILMAVFISMTIVVSENTLGETGADSDSSSLVAEDDPSLPGLVVTKHNGGSNEYTLYFAIDETKHTASLVNPKISDNTVTSESPYSGEIAVPSSFTYGNEPYTVTSIGKGAFAGSNIVDNSGLTGITLPDSIEVIGDGAFAYCTGLTSIEIPAKVTDLGLEYHSGDGRTKEGIFDHKDASFFTFAEGSPFSKDANGIIYKTNEGGTFSLIIATDPTIEEVRVKDGTITIEGGAFLGCTEVERIYLPDGLKTIGDGAFNLSPVSKHNLEYINIPSTVDSVGKGFLKYALKADESSIVVFEGNNCPKITESPNDKTFGNGYKGNPKTIQPTIYYLVQPEDNDSYMKNEKIKSFVENKSFQYGMNLDDAVITVSVDSSTQRKIAVPEGFTLTAYAKDNNIISTQITGSQITITGVNGKGTDLTLTFTKGNLTITQVIKVSVNGQIATFDPGWDGGNTTSVIANDDGTVKLPPALVRVGYIFNGWSETKNGYVLTGNPKITGNTTFYGVWTPIKYTVHYDGNGATGTIADTPATYDTEFTPISTGFTYDGHVFKGWSIQRSGSPTTYPDGQSIVNLTTENNKIVTLYAQWDPKKYTVTFNPNGADGDPTTQKVMHGIPTALDKCPFTRTGMYFDSWNTAEDGLGSKMGSAITAESDIVLYAQWIPRTNTLVFDPNGGTGNMTDQQVTFGTPVALNKNSFTRSGYTFSGWNTMADGSGKRYSDGQTVSDMDGGDFVKITLYAQWTKNYVPPSGGGGSSGGSGGTTTPPKPVITPGEDGGTTETTTSRPVTNPDGSKTTTVDVVEKDKEGNVTGSSQTETTTSTKKENGSTITSESTTTTKKDADGNVMGSTTSSTVKTESSTTTTIVEKEEVKDADDNVTLSTEKTTETVKIDGGTLVSEKTEVTDASGNVTTTENVKAESSDGVIKTTVESDDSATTVSTVIATSGKVDDKVIEMAIAQSDAVSGKVSEDDHSKVIQIDTGSDTVSAEVSLSPESLSAIAEKGAEFKVVCKTGTMQLDRGVIDTLTDPRKDVTVTMFEPTRDDLTEAQVSAKGDRFGVSMHAVVGEDRYHMLGGKVTVTIPYDVEAGSDYGIFYIDEQGMRTFMDSVYDEVMKAFVFETDHFSLFVVDEVPAPAEDTDDNTLLYIGAAVGIIIVIAVAAVLIRRH